MQMAQPYRPLFTATAVGKHPQCMTTTWEVVGPLGVDEITLLDCEAHNIVPWERGRALFSRLWEQR